MAKTEKTKRELIMEYGDDIPAVDVVAALKKRGVETTISGVYTARSAMRTKKKKKPGPRSSAAPKAKPRKKTRTAKKLPAAARKKKKKKKRIQRRKPERQPEPAAVVTFDQEDPTKLLGLKMELAAERAKREVLEDFIADNQ